MKTIIIYYTFAGTSRKVAQKLMRENPDATLCEITENKKWNIFTSFVVGCPKAMGRKASVINKIEHDLSSFDKLFIVCPIWAGHPAPPFNAIVDILPAGKEVELFLCSGSGNAQGSEAGTEKMIAARGCTLAACHNIKTSDVSN